MNWDDYRLILAIARAGGLPAAAQQLGVTLSTVLRRLDRVEADLAVRLFDRRRGDYQPTPPGREVVAAAERMEQEALAASRIVSGRDQQLTGVIRITTTEVLAPCFLARHIPTFQADHPGLFVEVISDNRRLSLADREADVSLTVRQPKQPNLVGRKIGTLDWGIYAQVGHEASPVSRLTDLAGAQLVAWEGSRAAHEAMTWIAQDIPDAEFPCRTSSLITNAALAASGMALAPLPCLLGSTWPGLKAIFLPVVRPSADLWLVSHEDLRRNARVRALIEFLAAAALRDRPLFAGL